MSDYNPFDSLTDNPKPNTKPIWSMNLDDPSEEQNVLRWLNDEVKYLTESSKNRAKTIEQNLALYKGVTMFAQEPRSTTSRDTNEGSRVSVKMTVNHMYDLTEAKVSRLIKYRPAVEILPTNDEFSDKISAKVTKYLLDHIWYQENFDGLLQEVTKISKVTGEGYLFIEWDPFKGDVHPASPKKGEKVPMVDEYGKPRKDKNGNPLFIEEQVKVGDIKYTVVFPSDILLERAKRYELARYLFRRDRKNTVELQQMYPEKADKIKSDSEGTYFDWELMEHQKLHAESLVYYFYHKRCRYMQKGRFIVFTKDCILENIELPYTMDEEFPCERLPDVVVPNEVHARSFYTYTKHIARQIDNMTSMVYRNQVFVSHPKWMVPAGSAKIESLGNNISIVQYKGAVPPALVQSNPTPSETFKFIENQTVLLQKIAGVYGQSRGDPEPGIKSFVALQYMSELERERNNSDIAQFNEFVRKVAVKTVAVCGQYYDKSDQRTIRVIGKNNAWMSTYFDAAHLDKDYDIRIQNASALPVSKAAQIQTLSELKEKFPTLVSDEQFIDMVGFGQSEKFYNIASSAVAAAEAENEDMASGKSQEEPTVYEDLVQHWKVHAQFIQNRSFKTMTPKPIQEMFEKHILATEYLMFEKAKNNPSFANLVAALPLWPIFFTIPQAAPPPPPEPPVEQPLPVSEESLPVDAGRDLQGEPVAPPAAPLIPSGASPEQEPSLGIEPTGAI